MSSHAAATPTLNRGRTERLIAIGGATGIFAGEDDPRWGGLGRPALFSDTSEVYERDLDRNKIGARMVETTDFRAM